MAQGLNSVIVKRGVQQCQQPKTKQEGSNNCNNNIKSGVGSRRIFSPHFKLQVLDSYRNDIDCKGNQRATARKYGIHRRQIQKWLQVEENLRNSVAKGDNNNNNRTAAVALNASRLRDDSVCAGNVALLSASNTTTNTTLECNNFWSSHPAALPHTIERRSYSICSSAGSSSCSPLASPDPSLLSPIDLSFKRHNNDHVADERIKSPGAVAAPTLAINKRKNYEELGNRYCANNGWDLSVNPHKRKLEDDVEVAPSKAVKLFKPYLDDLGDSKRENNNNNAEVTSFTSFVIAPPYCSTENYYYCNNNSIICDSKCTDTYTLHELQPKSTYYYPHYPTPDEYENGSYYSHSYNLDFKLSTVDSFDNNSQECSKTPTSKYDSSVHRGPIHKWLMEHADEMRLKGGEIVDTVR